MIPHRVDPDVTGLLSVCSDKKTKALFFMETHRYIYSRIFGYSESERGKSTMSMKFDVMQELRKKPRRLKDLRAKLGNEKKLARALEDLEKEKRVICRDGIYALPDKPGAHTVTCTITKLGRGFGFAKPDDGSLDVFIPGRFLRGAMPGDLVTVAISSHPRVADSVEGEVTAILEEHNSFVGTIKKEEGKLVVMPDVCPACILQIKKSADGGAREGEKVAIEILERGDSHWDHRVGIAMRFGSAGEAKQCAKAILYGLGITRQFPQKVKTEAKQVEAAGLSSAEVARRRDLRDWDIFTIDSASTKDIDDAISIRREGNGYAVGVHIADVSHYVQPGTALDADALRRGTSVYYGDSVVAMLPRQLSNGICSLNEKEDRLAFSCLMQLDGAGNVTDFSFIKTVICSRVKGVYSEINAIYEGAATPEITQKYAPVAEALPLLHELYEKLAAMRVARGALAFESDEAKLIIDEEGKCVDVVKHTRGESEQMIEELMLLANCCAAQLARKLEIPFVYRVHERPDADRVEKLKSTLHAAGIDFHFAGDTPTVHELAQILDSTRGTPVERFVHTNVLRSMMKAKYEPAPKGHYGLALADYAHFTSPIRRYPDLAIHRILTDVCAGEEKETLCTKYMGYAAGAASQSSDCEVIAMQAERNIADCYKAEYMQRFIGESFDAVIASVTSFGIYVELPNTVEGLVRVAALSARPLLLTNSGSLADTSTGKTWRIGDTIRVTVTAVDVSQGNVDFEPAEA